MDTLHQFAIFLAYLTGGFGLYKGLKVGYTEPLLYLSFATIFFPWILPILWGVLLADFTSTRKQYFKEYRDRR